MRLLKIRIYNKNGKSVYPKKSINVKIYRGVHRGKTGTIVKVNKKGYVKVNIGSVLKDTFINTHYCNLGI